MKVLPLPFISLALLKKKKFCGSFCTHIVCMCIRVCVYLVSPFVPVYVCLWCLCVSMCTLYMTLQLHLRLHSLHDIATDNTCSGNFRLGIQKFNERNRDKVSRRTYTYVNIFFNANSASRKGIINEFLCQRIQKSV